MENAAPAARRDLEKFFDRLVPEDPNCFEHNDEGADDMPAHIRMALTSTSQAVPVDSGGCNWAPGRDSFCLNIAGTRIIAGFG